MARFSHSKNPSWTDALTNPVKQTTAVVRVSATSPVLELLLDEIAHHMPSELITLAADAPTVQRYLHAVAVGVIADSIGDDPTLRNVFLNSVKKCPDAVAAAYLNAILLEALKRIPRELGPPLGMTVSTAKAVEWFTTAALFEKAKNRNCSDVFLANLKQNPKNQVSAFEISLLSRLAIDYPPQIARHLRTSSSVESATKWIACGTLHQWLREDPQAAADFLSQLQSDPNRMQWAFFNAYARRVIRDSRQKVAPQPVDEDKQTISFAEAQRRAVVDRISAQVEATQRPLFREMLQEAPDQLLNAIKVVTLREAVIAYGTQNPGRDVNLLKTQLVAQVFAHWLGQHTRTLGMKSIFLTHCSRDSLKVAFEKTLVEFLAQSQSQPLAEAVRKNGQLSGVAQILAAAQCVKVLDDPHLQMQFRLDLANNPQTAAKSVLNSLCEWMLPPCRKPSWLQAENRATGFVTVAIFGWLISRAFLFTVAEVAAIPNSEFCLSSWVTNITGAGLIVAPGLGGTRSGRCVLILNILMLVEAGSLPRMLEHIRGIPFRRAALAMSPRRCCDLYVVLSTLSMATGFVLTFSWLLLTFPSKTKEHWIIALAMIAVNCGVAFFPKVFVPGRIETRIA